jgi:RNA polymerase sigma-70 factor, ECF subfamily
MDVTRGEVDPSPTVRRMIEERDERRLIDGLRRDDRDSLAAVYDAYGSLAYGVALRVVGSQTEAEDVVQESFLALWRQADRIDPEKGLRGYLLSIVHRRAIDRLRRRGRRPETELDLDMPLPSGEEDPADTVARNAEREKVRAALVVLPPDQRRTVEMVYFLGLTMTEAAERLSIPVGTVKSRLRLALGRLRQELGTP